VGAIPRMLHPRPATSPVQIDWRRVPGFLALLACLAFVCVYGALFVVSRIDDETRARGTGLSIYRFVAFLATATLPWAWALACSALCFCAALGAPCQFATRPCAACACTASERDNAEGDNAELVAISLELS